MMWPPLALLAAPHYARLWSGKMEPPLWLLRPKVTYIWLASTIVGFAIAHWIAQGKEPLSSEAGQYLFTHSAPDDRIFVWGEAPKIYLDAHRRSAVVTSKRFHSPVISSAARSPVSIPGVESCPMPGPPSSEILPGIRRCTSSTFKTPIRRSIPCRSSPSWLACWRNGISL